MLIISPPKPRAHSQQRINYPANINSVEAPKPCFTGSTSPSFHIPCLFPVLAITSSSRRCLKPLIYSSNALSPRYSFSHLATNTILQNANWILSFPAYNTCRFPFAFAIKCSPYPGTVPQYWRVPVTPWFHLLSLPFVFSVSANKACDSSASMPCNP